MSYEPTNWQAGDTVTSAKLNKIEQGVENASKGMLLVQSSMEGYIETLDYTWKEIRDAALGGRPVFLKYYINDEEHYDTLVNFYIYPADPPNQNGYVCNFVYNGQFFTYEENGYPSADRE